MRSVDHPYRVYRSLLFQFAAERTDLPIGRRKREKNRTENERWVFRCFRSAIGKWFFGRVGIPDSYGPRRGLLVSSIDLSSGLEYERTVVRASVDPVPELWLRIVYVSRWTGPGVGIAVSSATWPRIRANRDDSWPVVRRIPAGLRQGHVGSIHHGGPAGSLGYHLS